jgi:chitodextrinase
LVSGVFLLGPEITHANGNVYVSRFWHNHQPLYWPEWNQNGGQTSRVEYAWDSIVRKSQRSYPGSLAQHPENDLGNIFGLDDRRNAYQSGPRNSLANIPNNGGFAVSYSGSLIDNVRQLGSLGQLGYGSGWNNGYREARNWRTQGGSGARRMDMVGFTYHHSLAPLIPKAVLRKELQIFKQAWWKAWGGNSDLSDHSKGYFPTEMAFSTHIVDVLVEEGYEWVIVPSHHLSRTCPTYNTKANPTGTYNIFSSPPNRADQLGPSPTSGWWYGEPNPGNAAWNVAPYAYQLHKVKYVNPETGAEKTMIAVPSDDVLSYRFGYANEGISKIWQYISPFATDPSRPVIVMPSTDGDNAWGGGSSSWFEATPQFFNDSAGAGYKPSTPQDFVSAHGAAAPVAHIEDGSWIFPESDYGSPYFLKWIEPPVSSPTSTSKVPGTVIDMETPGFALKFWSWAPVITGANWVETAEQILRDEGGSVEAWKIQAPYDWDGSWTNPNDVELAWHIYLGGLDSGFNYYGGLGNDDEVKAALATTRAIQKLQPWMTESRRNKDRTPPSVLKPQRFPYNPGGFTFGWFNSIPGGDTRYLKKMPSEFYIWTHAYDLSGVVSVNLKVRVDADGVNTLSSNQNETYAGGAEVGSWISIPMTKRVLPNSQAALNAAANNGQINYFITPPELADYYFAKISNLNLPGFRGKLLDYYIEATDGKNNPHKSEIQHVFVEDDGSASTPPAAPTSLAQSLLSANQIILTWAATPDATGFRIFRDGVETGTTSSTTYSDSTVLPQTTYTYSVVAGNSAGNSAPSAGFVVTTPAASAQLPAFSNSGIAPEGYLLSNPGMTLFAAVRGTKLFVATWFAGSVNGNDHFVIVANQLLSSSAGTPLLPGWQKAGTIAVPPTSAVLCMESTNGWSGWQKHDATGSSMNGTTSKNPNGQVEGVIDLVEVFGSVPPVLYFTSLAVQTANAGVVSAQAPAASPTDGAIEPTEFFAVPTNSLRDSVGDNRLDALVSEREFQANLLPATSGLFKISWPCVPGKSYQVSYKNSLTDPEWLEDLPASHIIAPTSGAISILEFEDPTLNLQQRFYRVEVGPF